MYVWSGGITPPFLIPVLDVSGQLHSHSLIELSPYWRTANCAATQEFPRILWNPKVHYRVLKSPTRVPILSQINPILITSSYLSKIYFNIVCPPPPWSSQWSLSNWLSRKYPPPFVLHHSNYTWRGVQVMKLLIMQFSLLHAPVALPRGHSPRYQLERSPGGTLWIDRKRQSTSLEIGARSIDWAQRSSLLLQGGDRILCPTRCVVYKNRTMNNVQKQ
jgi:hypothetical protein